jgi:hypothetical protein
MSGETVSWQNQTIIRYNSFRLQVVQPPCLLIRFNARALTDASAFSSLLYLLIDTSKPSCRVLMRVVPVVHWVTASGGWSVAVAVDLRGPETTVPVAAGWYLGSLVLFPSARP